MYRRFKTVSEQIILKSKFARAYGELIVNYKIVSDRPNKYLAHWQCSPAQWQTFGKAYWKIKSCWLFPLLTVLWFGLLSVLLLQTLPLTLESLSNKDEIIEEIGRTVILYFCCLLIIVFKLKKLKSDYVFYQKLRTEPVNIYIDRARIIIDNREYKLGGSIIADRCRLTIGKAGRLSLLMFKVLRYKKGFRIETIFVPVPQKYESEARELLQFLAPTRSSYPKIV